MIPWTAFHSSETHPDWRVDLNEDNLYHFVARGPNQLKRGLMSSMLDLEHERQFAISQIGTQSARFEFEHGQRIQAALHHLLRHFSTHRERVNESCRPNSPHADYLADFRIKSCGFDPLPPLDFGDSHPLTVELLPPSPPMSPKRVPLALRELMNPVPTPSPRPKRKLSSGPVASLVAADEFDAADDLDELDPDALLHTPLKYARANQTLRDGSVSRTRREVRMRRSGFLSQDPREEEQCEKDDLQ